MNKENCLDQKIRAEDILLGNLGFDTDAKIIEVRLAGPGYAGRAKFSDGEVIDFESTEELSDLERWALEILKRDC